MLQSHFVDRFQWLFFFLMVVCIKLLFFYFDRVPMFFLGDSISYLATALDGKILLDRSFVYGFVIRYIALATHSLTSLVAFQVLLSSVTAMLAAYALARFFAVKTHLACALGILCALDPLQLLYERYVMTETISLFVFAVYMVFIFHYLDRPRLVFLALAQLAGTVLISFRVSFLPIVLFNAVLMPLLAIPVFRRMHARSMMSGMNTPAGDRPRRRLSATVLLHLVVSAGLTFGLHQGYKQFYGHLVGGPPAYQYESGFFLVAAWGPVVKPVDFPYPELAGPIFGNLRFDLADRATRDPQRWMEGGLVANITDAIPDLLQAERAAKETALNALKRDPWGIVTLAVQGFTDYWRRDILTQTMVTDRGSDRELPGDLLRALQYLFGLDARNFPFLTTITNTYYFIGWPWYLFLLCSPLVAVISMLACGKETRRYLLVASVAVVAVAAVACALINRPTVRFLHPLGWLLCIVAGPLLNRFGAERKAGVTADA